jgi:hypothetical protein
MGFFLVSCPPGALQVMSAARKSATDRGYGAGAAAGRLVVTFIVDLLESKGEASLSSGRAKINSNNTLRTI